MSARTVTPAISDRRHPHSRGTWERVKHWLYSDPPLSELREADEATWPAWTRFWIARAIRYSWLRRDVTPGIAAGVVAFALFRNPIVALLAAGLVGYWSLRLRDKASDDRRSHRIKRTFQRACLDCGIRPVPAVLWSAVKPHVTLIGIHPIQGTDEKDLTLKVVKRMRSALHAPVRCKHNDDGTAVLSIHHSDPLKDAPPLPAYLGNEHGANVQPTWHHFPLGIDPDGEVLYVNQFENNFLLPGAQRTGKSIALAAVGIGCLAAPFVELWGAIDPQVVSLRCFKNLVRFAASPEQALELLQDFQRSMQKREAAMDEAGTSLATPGFRWPLKVLLIDELLRLIDADLRDELDGKYAEKFVGILKDVLRTGPKTGHVIWATTTDPRQKALPEGLRDMFSTRLIFRTVDANASAVVGCNTAGYKAHELPATPGRAILRGAELTHCRTWGVWDVQALQAARAAAESLLPDGEQASEPAADPAVTWQTPSINGGSLPTSAGLPVGNRHDTRSVILDYCLKHPRFSFRQISQATGVPQRTVSSWFSEERTNRIQATRLGGGVYELVR